MLYPAQTRQPNAQGCWNWFKHNHQGRGEPAILADMARHIAQSHCVDPERVYVAGLSAGGAMAAILAPSNGERVAQVHGGNAVSVDEQRGLMTGSCARTRRLHKDAQGQVITEQWVVHGAGHAWSGGDPAGSYADARGPDASAEMVRFFLQR